MHLSIKTSLIILVCFSLFNCHAPDNTDSSAKRAKASNFSVMPSNGENNDGIRNVNFVCMNAYSKVTKHLLPNGSYKYIFMAMTRQLDTIENPLNPEESNEANQEDCESVSVTIWPNSAVTRNNCFPNDLSIGRVTSGPQNHLAQAYLTLYEDDFRQSPNGRVSVCSSHRASGDMGDWTTAMIFDLNLLLPE